MVIDPTIIWVWRAFWIPFKMLYMLIELNLRVLGLLFVTILIDILLLGIIAVILYFFLA